MPPVTPPNYVHRTTFDATNGRTIQTVRRAGDDYDTSKYGVRQTDEEGNQYVEQKHDPQYSKNFGLGVVAPSLVMGGIQAIAGAPYGMAGQGFVSGAMGNLLKSGGALASDALQYYNPDSPSAAVAAGAVGTAGAAFGQAFNQNLGAGIGGAMDSGIGAMVQGAVQGGFGATPYASSVGAAVPDLFNAAMGGSPGSLAAAASALKRSPDLQRNAAAMMNLGNNEASDYAGGTWGNKYPLDPAFAAKRANDAMDRAGLGQQSGMFNTGNAASPNNGAWTDYSAHMGVPDVPRVNGQPLPPVPQDYVGAQPQAQLPPGVWDSANDRMNPAAQLAAVPAHWGSPGQEGSAAYEAHMNMWNDTSQGSYTPLPQAGPTPPPTSPPIPSSTQPPLGGPQVAPDLQIPAMQPQYPPIPSLMPSQPPAQPPMAQYQPPLVAAPPPQRPGIPQLPPDMQIPSMQVSPVAPTSAPVPPASTRLSAPRIPLATPNQLPMGGGTDTTLGAPQQVPFEPVRPIPGTIRAEHRPYTAEDARIAIADLNRQIEWLSHAPADYLTDEHRNRAMDILTNRRNVIAHNEATYVSPWRRTEQLNNVRAERNAAYREQMSRLNAPEAFPSTVDGARQRALEVQSLRNYMSLMQERDQDEMKWARVHNVSSVVAPTFPEKPPLLNRAADRNSPEYQRHYPDILQQIGDDPMLTSDDKMNKARALANDHADRRHQAPEAMTPALYQYHQAVEDVAHELTPKMYPSRLPQPAPRPAPRRMSGGSIQPALGPIPYTQPAPVHRDIPHFDDLNAQGKGSYINTRARNEGVVRDMHGHLAPIIQRVIDDPNEAERRDGFRKLHYDIGEGLILPADMANFARQNPTLSTAKPPAGSADTRSELEREYHSRMRRAVDRLFNDESVIDVVGHEVPYSSSMTADERMDLDPAHVGAFRMHAQREIETFLRDIETHHVSKDRAYHDFDHQIVRALFGDRTIQNVTKDPNYGPLMRYAVRRLNEIFPAQPSVQVGGAGRRGSQDFSIQRPSVRAVVPAPAPVNTGTLPIHDQDFADRFRAQISRLSTHSLAQRIRTLNYNRTGASGFSPQDTTRLSVLRQEYAGRGDKDNHPIVQDPLVRTAIPEVSGRTPGYTGGPLTSMPDQHGLIPRVSGRPPSTLADTSAAASIARGRPTGDLAGAGARGYLTSQFAHERRGAEPNVAPNLVTNAQALLDANTTADANPDRAAFLGRGDYVPYTNAAPSDAVAEFARQSAAAIDTWGPARMAERPLRTRMEAMIGADGDFGYRIAAGPPGAHMLDPQGTRRLDSLIAHVPNVDINRADTTEENAVQAALPASLRQEPDAVTDVNFEAAAADETADVAGDPGSALGAREGHDDQALDEVLHAQSEFRDRTGRPYVPTVDELERTGLLPSQARARLAGVQPVVAPNDIAPIVLPGGGHRHVTDLPEIPESLGALLRAQLADYNRRVALPTHGEHREDTSPLEDPAVRARYQQADTDELSDYQEAGSTANGVPAQYLRPNFRLREELATADGDVEPDLEATRFPEPSHMRVYDPITFGNDILMDYPDLRDREDLAQYALRHSDDPNETIIGAINDIERDHPDDYANRGDWRLLKNEIRRRARIASMSRPISVAQFAQDVDDPMRFHSRFLEDFPENPGESQADYERRMEDFVLILDRDIHTIPNHELIDWLRVPGHIPGWMRAAANLDHTLHPLFREELHRRALLNTFFEGKPYRERPAVLDLGGGFGRLMVPRERDVPHRHRLMIGGAVHPAFWVRDADGIPIMPDSTPEAPIPKPVADEYNRLKEDLEPYANDKPFQKHVFDTHELFGRIAREKTYEARNAELDNYIQTHGLQPPSVHSLEQRALSLNHLEEPWTFAHFSMPTEYYKDARAGAEPTHPAGTYHMYSGDAAIMGRVPHHNPPFLVRAEGSNIIPSVQRGHTLRLVDKRYLSVNFGNATGFGINPLGRQLLEVPPTFFMPPTSNTQYHPLDRHGPVRDNELSHPLIPVDRKYEETFHAIHSMLQSGLPEGQRLAARLYDQLPTSHRGIYVRQPTGLPARVREEMRNKDLVDQGRLLASRTRDELQSAYHRAIDRWYASPEQLQRIANTHSLMNAIFDGASGIQLPTPGDDNALQGALANIQASGHESYLQQGLRVAERYSRSLLGWIVGQDQGDEDEAIVPHRLHGTGRSPIPQQFNTGIRV